MTHITFQEFIDKTMDTLKSFLPEDYADADIRIQKRTKPGDRVLTGISICRPNCNAAPIFYLDDMYQRYCDGEPFEMLMKNLAQHIVRETLFIPDPQRYLTWDAAKKYVTSRLINRERNAGYLADRPFIPIKESPMVIIFDIDLSKPTNQDISIPVTFSLMEHWETTVADLDKIAKINNPLIRPVSIHSMKEMLADIFPDVEISETPFPFFLITNENMSHGAIAVTYTGVEEQLKQLLGDFYLIPSSIHEMLAISRNTAAPEVLSEMIQEINDTQVSTEEVLDNVPYMLENGQLISVRLEPADNR